MPGEVLSGMAQGFAPIASGYQPQFRTGMEGVPFFQNHPIMSMLAQPHVQRMMNGMGLVPTGLGHDQNLYDVLRHRNFMMMQQATLNNTAYLDRENMMRTLRGMAAMAGVPYGAAARRQAGVIADWTQTAAPMMAMIRPEWLDAMGGSRGSATVMASQMMMGSRYMMDPLTGRLGMNSEAVGRMASQMYQSLFSRESLPQMHGLSAGQAGALFNQLAQRGMIAQDPMNFNQRFGSAVGMLSPRELAQAATRQGVRLPVGPNRPGEHGFSAADMDRLALDPAIGDRMRSFDSSRITRTIQGYSRAISAMRDIFGDMGRPNAPMAELMQSLEAMTNGAMSQMDPNRVARVVRQTYNLARGSGVSLDSAMMMQQHAAQHAATLGLEPIFGVHATQGSLAFGGAYRGRGLGAVTGWGVFNSDQMQQLDSNLRIGAAASSQANRLAVAVRLSNQHGGFMGGTDAYNMIQAVRGGFQQFDMGGRMTNLADLSQRDFNRVLTSARWANGSRTSISEGDIREMLGQTFSNREVVDSLNLGGLVRNMQGRQVNTFLGHRLRETLVNRLRGMGVSQADATGSMGNIREAMNDIAALPDDVRTNAASRNEALAEIFRRRLTGTAAGTALNRMAPHERNAFLHTTAERFWGRANEALRRSDSYRGYGSVENALRANDPTTLRLANQDQMRRAFEGQLADALSPLGRGSAMRSLFDALQNARPGDNLATIAGRTLGVRATDINSALTTPMQQLANRARQIQALQNRISSAAPGAERTSMQRQLEGLLRETRATASDVARTAMEHGFFGEGDIRARDTHEALDLQVAVVQGIQDVSGISSGMGLAVSNDQLGVLRTAGRAGMNADDLRALITARNYAAAGTISETDPDLTAAAARLRRENPRMTPEAARTAARRELTAFRRRYAGNVSAADIAAERTRTTALTDTELQAVALDRRGRVALRPTEAAVRQYMRDHPGVRESDARGALMADLRAQRLGIEDRDINAIIARRPGGRTLSRREAIDYAIAAADAAQYTVNATQREAARAAGDVPASATDAQADAFILNQRYQRRRQGFQRFWSAPDGAMFGEHVDMLMEQNQTISERLVTNRNVSQRFGTQAVEWHRRLADINQRRRVLAQQYAGGSVRRLLARDYEGRLDGDTAIRVQQELIAMHGTEREIYERLHSTHGRRGRQFRQADEEDAIKSLRSRGEAINPESIALERTRLGDVSEAGQILNLTATQMQRLLTAPVASLTAAERAQRTQLHERTRLVGIARLMTSRDEQLLRASHGRTTPAVRDMAARLDVSVADLRRIQTDVFDRQLDVAETARQRATQGGNAVVRDLTAAFGISSVAGDRRAEELARQIGASPQARAMGQYFIWTQQRIAAAARDLRGGGGQAALARRYREAMAHEEPTRTAAMRNLQRDLRIDMTTRHGRERWEDVSRALDWQNRYGLLNNRGEGRMTTARLGEAWDRMRRSGERIPSQGPGGLPGAMRIHGNLDIHLRSDGTGTGGMDAHTTGAPTNVTAPG